MFDTFRHPLPPPEVGQPEVGHEGRRREDVALPPWVGHLGIEGGGDDKHKDHDDDDEVDGREDLLQTNAMLSKVTIQTSMMSH